MKHLLNRLFSTPKPRFKKGDCIRLKIARFAFIAGVTNKHKPIWIESKYTLKYSNETEDNYLFTTWIEGKEVLVYIGKVAFENLKYTII